MRGFDRLTVRTVTRGGELIAYGDPRVTDVERAAAGRETLAARDRELLEENRRRAVRRRDAADLPDGQNLARIWLPRDPAALWARLRADDLAVWAEADVLHVVWRGTAAAVEMYGGVGVQLWAVPGTADLWEASLRIRDLDRAVLSLSVAPHVDGELPTGLPPAATVTWRGPAAPPAAAVAEPAGTLVDRSVAGSALGGSRTVTVYRPPGDHGALPGCVLADGQSTRSFAEVLEPAILDGRAPPVVVVGIHSGLDGDRRAPGVAAFSAGIAPRRLTAASQGSRHYLAAGSLEEGFRDATSGWAGLLAAAGRDVRYDEWTGGHDAHWWPRALPRRPATPRPVAVH